MSKGLEALKDIRDSYIDSWYGVHRCEIIEKELKALEVIKNKKVNIFTFYECCNWYNPSHYNDSIGCPVNCELTQEEYDLLKEVLL